MSFSILQCLILKKLKFHLTVHSPFRPLEGFIIGMKVIVYCNTCFNLFICCQKLLAGLFEKLEFVNFCLKQSALRMYQNRPFTIASIIFSTNIQDSQKVKTLTSWNYDMWPDFGKPNLSCKMLFRVIHCFRLVTRILLILSFVDNHKKQS